MGKIACDAARAVGYVNAGTVEFLYDCETKEFYFMEMNTRLQVEHPVTEMITGLDLVEWQLKIASGQRLPKLQDELRINGHSIEARVYSEDPFNFLPGGGRVDYYKEPANVRIDSGVLHGSEIGIHYDPMISKLIVWGQDRNIAVQKMRKAISEYKIGGLVTNLPLLKRLVDHPKFEDFSYDLKFIEEYSKDLIPKTITITDDTLIAAAFAAVNSLNDKVIALHPARCAAPPLQLQSKPPVQQPLQSADHQRSQQVGSLRHRTRHSSSFEATSRKTKTAHTSCPQG
jgi:3-methylcrotonyl-CoA carboxylase alpha subunit